jgi:hypothetical protein
MIKCMVILLALLFCFNSCGVDKVDKGEIFVCSASSDSDSSSAVWIGASVTSEAILRHDSIAVEIGWDVTDKKLSHGKIEIKASGFEIYMDGVLVGTDGYSFEYEDIGDMICYCRLWKNTEYETGHHKTVTLRLYDPDKTDNSVILGAEAWEVEDMSCVSEVYLNYELASDTVRFFGEHSVR